MKKRIGCFLALLVLAAAPARAAGDLTIFGGFHHPGEITLGSIGTLPFGQITDPKDFGVFGVRYNNSRSFVGFENTLAYSPNFVDSDAFAFIQSSNLIIGVPALRVRPYGTAGIGFIYAGGDGPASVGSKFAFNYGGGVKVTLAGPLGFRADVRGYAIPSMESQTLHVLESSVGLLIGF
jgi:hypothetical protein